MGYWEQDSNGHSFSRDTDEELPQEKQLIWGDDPADIMGA